MSKKETNLQFKDCFQLPNNGLRAYLEHVKEGESTIIRTPLFNEENPVKVMDRWSRILEPGVKSMDGLLDFENDLRSKVGPMSVMKPLVERLDDIDSYYEDIYLSSKPISDEAVSALLESWEPKIGGLRLRSPANTWKKMRKSTNSGAPFFTKRRTVWDKIGDDYHQSELTFSCRGGAWGNCAILGWRGQEGGPSDDDVKQRVVWMFPMYVNVEELRLYQPFIEAVQHFNLVPAWNGNDAVDREITKLFDSKSPNDLVVCTDFSKFDQHFNGRLQRVAEIVIQHLLTPLHWQWLYDIFPIKYNIPLCYEWGSVREGNHGMGSGSGGTNADETIAHKTLQIECALEHGQQLNPHSMCLGDDGILSYPGISVQDVLDSYTSHGLEMNESKQSASTTECTYLRRWYSTNYRIDGVCRGVYSTYRALGRLMYQERFYNDWSEEMVVMRALSIVENCRYHPLREKFLDYVLKGDKFKLGLDIPGFFDRLGRLAKEAMERGQDFMSYSSTFNENGIENWWVVKALKSRA